jgi:ABC-2 type transport system permease protein
VLLRIEFIKLWRKPRTYLGFAGMAGIIGLMFVAMRFGHPFRHLESVLAGRFIMAGSYLNAEFIAHLLLPGAVAALLPLFTAMVFGDLIASEAADGTMRTMLCRPVSRASVGIAKYMTGLVYVLVLTLGTGLVAFLTGWLVFGKGWLLVVSSGTWIFEEPDAIRRLIAAYGMAAASMLAVGSIAFALSSFLSNSNGSIIGAMVVLYGLTIVGEIDYFDPIKPYLFTSYMDSWRELFVNPIDMSEVWRAVGTMLAYAAAFLALGLAIFQRKDVLS